MIPALIREMLPEERNMVLSDWKQDLWASKPLWGIALHATEWWALINHVIDNHTLPSSTVWVVCHRNEPSVALCWAATRNGVLHLHASKEVLKEPDLAAYLERSLRDHIGANQVPFNPFLELKKCHSSR